MTERGSLCVLCAGLNHKTAPLEIREQIAFSKDDLPQAVLDLRKYGLDGVILSTCNRTEVYTISKEAGTSTQDIWTFLAEFHSLESPSFTPHMYRYEDREAIRHLFRVASGLDSMILGESQILGQVRDALTASASLSSPSMPLSRLFHYALRAGRRVREETDIGEKAPSVSDAGVKLVHRVLGDTKSKSILLVGAGEAGRLVARALRNLGVEDFMVSNRTFSRAEELCQELHGRPIPFDHVMDSMKESDIVISSTDAPEVIFTQDALADAMDARNGRPLFIFDLGVPRDIDPAAANLQGIHLFNIDDLDAKAEGNRLEREGSVPTAEIIVEEEVDRFTRWWRSLDVAPLIIALRHEAEAIRKSEVEKVLRRWPDVTPEEQKAVEQLSRSIVNKLLHRPITSLKDPRAAAHLQAIKELIQLNNTGEPDRTAEPTPDRNKGEHC